MGAGACGVQQRVLDPLKLELQTVVNCNRCWEPDLGPLQEQQVLLALSHLSRLSLCLETGAHLVSEANLELSAP